MDELEKYYQYLKSKGANIPPSVDIFRVNLQDPVKAEKYYQYLVNNKFNVAPTYESFTTTLGLKKKEQPQVEVVEEVGGEGSVQLSQSKSSLPSQYTGTVDFNKLNALQGGSQATTPQQEELAQYGTETVKATKEKQEKDITDAATNTALLYAENNPSLFQNYGLSKNKSRGGKFDLTQLKNATPFQQKVAELTNEIKNGKYIVSTDNTGKKIVARPMGDWDNLKNGVNDVWNANEEIEKWDKMSDDEKIKAYTEFKPDKAILPLKPDTESFSYAAGQTLPTVGKIAVASAAAAALEAAAPETLGVSLTGITPVMVWAALVPNIAKHNQMISEMEAFKNIKSNNPNISNEEALKIAKDAGVVGYAKGLAVGTGMQFIGQGSLPPNTGQGLLKATGQFLKNQPQSITEVGALSIGSSYIEEKGKNLIGAVDENFAEKAGKVLNTDAIGQLAFNVGFGIMGAPKYVKAQANEVLSKMDTEVLQMMQQRAVDEGLLNEQQINEANKSLQDYKAAKSKMPPLGSEEKTAVIAGLIQKKQNLERLKTENDKSFHDEIDAQIEATDQRIQLAKKSNNPIKYAEQDDLDGQKNFTPKPFESLSKKEIEGIAEEVPKEYGEAEAIEIGGDAEGSAKKYKAEATVTRQQGFIKIKDKIPVDDKVYNDKVDAEAAAQRALAEHYYNNAMDETLKPENKSSVTVIRPEEMRSPEIIENVKVEEAKDPIQQTMEGGRTSDELISTEKSSDTESIIPETTRTTAEKQATLEKPEIVKLKQERDVKIKAISKPKVKLQLVGTTDLVNSADPIGNKKIHDGIKNRYIRLRQLIDCL